MHTDTDDAAPTTTTRPFLEDLRAPGLLAALGYAFVAFIFAVSGPLLILLNAARIAHLSPEAVESWIFAGYGVGAVMTIVLSMRFRMPIASAWSIPGCVLVGGTLAHATLAEAVGVYLAAGVVALLLGVTGLFRKILDKVPMPVILGMIAGVLTPFVVDVARSGVALPSVAVPPIVAFVVVSRIPRVARRAPPILWAALVGIGAAAAADTLGWSGVEVRLARPMLPGVAFSLSAMTELLIPLVLTMLVVQDAQTITLLRSAKYEPPVNPLIAATGIGTLLGAPFGSHSSCTAPVMTGILLPEELGPKELRYRAAVLLGVLTVPFALFAPVATSVATALPVELIRVLAGLAVFPVLANQFGQAFAGKFRLGSVAAFAVTSAGISIAGIGAPFWGLVFGTALAVLLEPRDFVKNS